MYKFNSELLFSPCGVFLLTKTLFLFYFAGPCTVNSDDMAANNIEMVRGYNKLYLEHNDHITFHCIRGTYRVVSQPMRQRCDNGVMVLPKCQ